MTCCTGEFVFPNFIKEGFLALCKVFLNRQLSFRVICRQVLQLRDELLSNAPVRIGKLQTPL